MGAMLCINPKMRPSPSALLKFPWLKVGGDCVPFPTVRTLFRNALVNLAEGQFKKLVIRLMIEQMPKDHDHLKQATEVFCMLDRDRDGVVDAQEFMDIFAKLPDLTTLIEDPRTVFDAFDRDSSGALNLNEFAAATLPQATQRDEDLLWQVFRTFDRNGSNLVTIDEVMEVTRLLEGRLLGPGQLDELVEAIRLELETMLVPPDPSAVTEPIDENGQPLQGMEKLKFTISSFSPILSKYRRIDYGEFIYLCDTRAKIHKWFRVARKEAYRIAEKVSGIGLYPAPHNMKDEDLPWAPEEVDARSSHSVHRRTGGLTGGGRKKQVGKRSTRAKDRRQSALTDE